MPFSQLTVPLEVFSTLGLGDYTQAANTDFTLNTSAAALSPNIKGLLELEANTDPVQTYESNTYRRMLDSAAAIKSGAGTVGRLAVSAAGTAISVTVYDSLTAAGTIIFGPYVLVAGASIPIEAGFATGLSVGFSATTGTPSATITYR